MTVKIQSVSHAKYVLQTAKGMLNHSYPKARANAVAHKAAAEKYLKEHKK